MAAEEFDVVVVGAGPGGYVCAIRAAQLGLRACVVEREHLGGVCLNWGCIPTKTMLRSAELYETMRHAQAFGLSVEGVALDLDAVVARSRAVATRLSGGVAHLLKKNRVAVAMGTATLEAADRVRVEGEGPPRVLRAPNVVLAAGARARDVPGLEPDGDRVWSYRHALVPPFRPRRVLVVGSGAIGVEFASFHAAIGADVTLIEAAARILPAEDAEIAAAARKAFERRGMTVRASAKVARLDRRADGVTAWIDDAAAAETALEADAVIMAVGVVANTEGLGLEGLGVALERGRVVTDGKGRTGVAGLWAIGDLTAGPWLAHKASQEGVAVAEAIAGGAPHALDPAAIAGCTYCTPQIASVGLTEDQARELGYALRVGRVPFAANGKALAMGEEDGFVKTVFDAETGELLGAHMIGADVTELIQGFVVGRALETTEAELAATVFPHPTLSEVMHESVLAAYDRALHV